MFRESDCDHLDIFVTKNKSSQKAIMTVIRQTTTRFLTQLLQVVSRPDTADRPVIDSSSSNKGLWLTRKRDSIKHFYFWLCWMNFYPRDAMLARVIVIATCPSVCPSRAGIVSKRRKLAAGFCHRLIAPRLVFWRQISSPNSKGFPPNGGLKQG